MELMVTVVYIPLDSLLYLVVKEWSREQLCIYAFIFLYESDIHFPISVKLKCKLN